HGSFWRGGARAHARPRSCQAAPAAQHALHDRYDHGPSGATRGEHRAAARPRPQRDRAGEKVGNAFARVVTSLGLGMANGLAEEWPAAIAALESGLTLARDRHASLHMEPWLLTILAEANLGAGDTRLARARAEEALALARQRETLTQEIDAQLAVARVRRCAEGLSARSAIEAALERAGALVRETGARALEPYVCLERAELARLGGDVTIRKRELREAHRLFTEMGASIRAAEVAKELSLAAVS